MEKCVEIRRMAKSDDGEPNKCYKRRVDDGKDRKVQYVGIGSSLPPRYFIFAYRGWESACKLLDNFKSATSKQSEAHVHGLCVINSTKDYFLHHIAYKNVKERCSSVYCRGFRELMMQIPGILESMIPADRYGFGFDQFNMERYDVKSATVDVEEERAEDKVAGT